MTDKTLEELQTRAVEGENLRVRDIIALVDEVRRLKGHVRELEGECCVCHGPIQPPFGIHPGCNNDD